VKRLSLLLASLLCLHVAQSAERRAFQDVDVSALTRQLMTIEQGKGIAAAIWWPPEVWSIGLAREPGIPEDARKSILEQLGRYTLIGVVDATLTPGGGFEFATRDAVLKKITIDWTGPKGSQRMVPLASVPDELKAILQNLEPMMQATLGELGKNLHILIIADDAATGRLMSPYENGSLAITMMNGKASAPGKLLIETPADALFVPRMCPNGKSAHVTWKVCPWDGSKLPD
jgi:hypothetical protein